jgi:RNA polymerase sigma factor (sigma-70 family)
VPTPGRIREPLRVRTASLARTPSRAGLASLVSASLGCSLTTIDPVACTEHDDCRTAFGVGSVCGDDGYCSELRTHPRCSRSWPPELVDAPQDFGDAIVVGSLFGFTDHEDTRRAAELAIREVGLQQGLQGRTIAMLHCDTTADVDGLDDIEGAAAAARFLAETVGVPAIVGPRGSSRTQAVFEALLEQLPKIREHARVPGFLRTCAVRIALRQVKRSRWRRNRAELAFAFDPQQFVGDQPAMAAMVRQLLARLDPEERAALVLKCVELHSHEEVAELMGVSVATARRRLDSARRKLGAMVGETRVDEILGGAMAVAAGAEA